ncbi:MAG TPA: HDOD domain-containing protein [Acidobacteriota bacterium]|nr:HDOD domain-containing protein [Acidobacteriota bacterium]
MSLPAGLLNRIEHLDPMPITAQKLLGMLNDDNISLNEIAKVVELDEALMANTLRVANSVYFQRGREIKDARSAVVRLGTTNLLNIVLGQFLHQISVPAPLYDLSEDELWFHSTVASLAAEEVSRLCPVKIPEISRVAALVHDVGKLIMVRYFKADFKGVLKLAEEKDVSFVEAERQLFGCDHPEVGGAMAREWGFPEEVRDAIERHHTTDLQDSHPVLDTVIVSNLVAKTMATWLGAEGLNFEVDLGVRDRLKLTFNRFCQICAAVETRMEHVRNAYGIR